MQRGIDSISSDSDNCVEDDDSSDSDSRGYQSDSSESVGCRGDESDSDISNGDYMDEVHRCSDDGYAGGDSDDGDNHCDLWLLYGPGEQQYHQVIMAPLV